MANSDGALDVGRLRVLREVGLRGTIAGAARSLGLTPSAVSQQLALLEREAGTALCDRSPRGVALTGAGHALAARAGEVHDVLQAARSDLDRIAGTLGGPVRVAAVASAAVSFGSAAVTTLAETHPGIDVLVTVAEPGTALRMLVAGDLDVAIVDEYDYVPLALPDFVVARELCREPLVLIAARGRNESGDLADLSGADWVMASDDASCGLAVRAACRAAGFEPRVRWTSDDMLVLARAVGAGHGIAVLPRLSVAADAADIVVHALRTPRLERRLRAVARSAALTRPTVAAVLDAMAKAAVDSVPHID